MSKSMDGREAKNATAIAVTEGLSSAFPVALASGAAIGLGHKFHAGFAKNVGASGKVAMAIMPPFFAFVLAGEHAINRTAAAVVSLVLCFGFKDIMTKAGAPFDVGDD
ncbi:hypothetical protein JL722_3168 [Aureococcus anophagefferens]|nr:hypothetical protein JL722_3168 [Aureococcus anophagefferens]